MAKNGNFQINFACLPPNPDARMRRDNLVAKHRRLAAEANDVEPLNVSMLPFAEQLTQLEEANVHLEEVVAELRAKRENERKAAAEKAAAEKAAKEAEELAERARLAILTRNIRDAHKNVARLAEENGEVFDLPLSEVFVSDESLTVLLAETTRLQDELTEKRELYLPAIEAMEAERSEIAGRFESVVLDDCPEVEIRARHRWLEESLRPLRRAARKAEEGARAEAARAEALKKLPKETPKELAERLDARVRAMMGITPATKPAEAPKAPAPKAAFVKRGEVKTTYAKNDPRGMALSSNAKEFAEQVGLLNRLHEKAQLASDLRIGKHRLPEILAGNITPEHRQAAETLRIALGVEIARRESLRSKKAATEKEKKADNADKEESAAA